MPSKADSGRRRHLADRLEVSSSQRQAGRVKASDTTHLLGGGG